jgi:23S rRNA (adenine2503-C2)-methyltransferase
VIEIPLKLATDVDPTATVAASSIAAAPDGRTNLLELDRVGLERLFEETLGEKRFRAHR